MKFRISKIALNQGHCRLVTCSESLFHFCNNKQGRALYHIEISMFLRGGTSQSAKYNKKSRKSYKDIDDLVDFDRSVHIVPHMFRHSFVSVMADKIVSLNVIREFVGHSEDSRDIEKIYLHVMQKGKHKIEQAMIDLAKIIK